MPTFDSALLIAALRIAAGDAVVLLFATVVYETTSGLIFCISAVTPLTSWETCIAGCSGAGAATGSRPVSVSGPGSGAAFCTGG